MLVFADVLPNYMFIFPVVKLFFKHRRINCSYVAWLVLNPNFREIFQWDAVLLEHMSS